MRWGRFGAFLVTVLVVLGLTAGTSMKLWKTIPLGLDLQGGVDALYQVDAPIGHTLTSADMSALVSAIEMRVNLTGASSPIIDVEGTDHIRVQLAGTFNQTQALDLIGATTNLAIYGDVTVDKKGQPHPKGQPLITGASLESNAHWGQDQFGQNVVDLTFKDAAKWQQITTQYTGKEIYTFLNGKLLTQARVDGPIPNGNTQLSGGPDFTPEYCTDLAKKLNAGALPYPLKQLSVSEVGPSLGAASLKATMWAGAVAIALIFLFMMLVYRMAGFIADIALVAYTYLLVLTFSGMHVVLTLPGLAALVLGVGMAVDANIIAYERIKDEIRNGKSLQSAVIAGNKRSLRTIIDSNATTFIAGAVMYWFGQGDIRGFAIALMISIIVSLLTAVLLSRLMLMWFTKSGAVRNPWWFGARKGVVKK